MTILDRLLSHDAWTTRQLLLRCRDLTDAQLDRQFEFGCKSLRECFQHIIACVEWQNDMLMGVESVFEEGETIEIMLKRHTAVSKRFAAFATKIEREGRADELVTNPHNGNTRTFGSQIAHLITHSMHHRAQVLAMLDLLGVENVIEGDVLAWESVTRGWGWEDGGSYGEMVVG